MYDKKIGSIGIDFSYTSPALCYSSGDKFEENKWFYLNSTKKRLIKTDNLFGEYLKEGNSFKNNFERFNYISDWFIEKIKTFETDSVHLEGYSMNSMGQVFDIAENTMLLKYKLKQLGYTIKIISPTQLKKFATTKGNADKSKMQNSFFDKTSIDIKSLLNQPEGQWNPSSDLIDAYYLARYGAMHSENDRYYLIL